MLMFKRLLFAFSLAFLPSLVLADEIVRYQLTQWKAKHIHDAKKADTITGTLKKLGCELKKHQHNGHIDVQYRCPKWRELKLDSHADAQKWEKWLKEFEFKTEHKH
jgi:hypothetical protein